MNNLTKRCKQASQASKRRQHENYSATIWKINALILFIATVINAAIETFIK